MTGNITNITIDYATGKPIISLMINEGEECLKLYDLLKDEEKLEIKIEKYRKKRSLNANAYCWTLIGKIAEEVGNTKEEVYREYIRNKGIYQVITLNNRAVPTFMKLWTEKGLGWLCETSETKIEGLTDVTAYYGTSSYNTKQMAGFVDYIVEEAKTLGIETLPLDEIERLKSLWV